MRKIFLLIILLLAVTSIPVAAEDYDSREENGESGFVTDNEISIHDFQNYADLLFELEMMDSARKERFFTDMSFEDRLYFITLRSNAREEGVSEFTGLLPVEADNALRTSDVEKLDGFQSGAFSYGNGVDPATDRKYVLENGEVIWSAPINKRSERQIIKSGTVQLWVPHWGTYLNEPVGALITVQRLHTDWQSDFQFATMENSFYLYLENAKQAKLTVHFYKNVDNNLAKPNGDVVELRTKFSHLLFGAMGLTNELDYADSIEYTAPVDDTLAVYSPLESRYIATAEEFGKKVYYNNRHRHNSHFVYDVKNLKEIAMLVGIKGSDNSRKGGDGSMLFSIGFNAHGMIPTGHVLQVDPNGGTYSGDKTVEGIAGDKVPIPHPFRQGFSFTGWDVKGGSYDKGIYTFEDTDGYLTAQWLKNEYPIRYILNGGRNHPKNPHTYTSEERVEILDPEKEGYLFRAWSEGNVIPPGSSGEKVFHAEWTPERFPIEYRLNGGINNDRNPILYTIEDEVLILDPHRDGYRFLRWQEGSLIEKGSTGKKIFTAEWEKELYPITYNLQDTPESPADNAGNPQEYSYEDHILLRDPLRRGYTFLGWQEGNEIKKGSTGKKHFTARWEKNIYHIYYDLDGGKNNPLNVSEFTVEDRVSFSEASRAYFTFHSWKRNEKPITQILPHTVFEDVYLKAHWLSSCDVKDKNCDGVIDCREEFGENYRWNNYQKICVYGKYEVVNTARF